LSGKIIKTSEHVREDKFNLSSSLVLTDAKEAFYLNGASSGDKGSEIANVFNEVIESGQIFSQYGAVVIVLPSRSYYLNSLGLRDPNFGEYFFGKVVGTYSNLYTLTELITVTNRTINLSFTRSYGGYAGESKYKVPTVFAKDGLAWLEFDDAQEYYKVMTAGYYAIP